MGIDYASFEAQVTQLDTALPIVAGHVLNAEDGTPLAWDWRGTDHPEDVVILYHGGGANRRAGYQFLANELSRNGGPGVCSVDIRGHGGSGGERGHCPSPKAVWGDVDTMIAHMRERFPAARIHLCGHSSGAGLLVNAYSGLKRRSDVTGLFLLAPEFGFRAGLGRETAASRQFAKARIAPFVLNGMSGGRLGGGMTAVQFDFASWDNMEAYGLVEKYTVNMANAVTPSAPVRQFHELTGPVWVGIGAEDELIDAGKLAAFVSENAPEDCRSAMIEGCSHLGIILVAAAPLRAAIRHPLHALCSNAAGE